jgi:hypothetical protein
VVLLFGENKTFHCLGETGHELKLTNFQEKSGGPKSSILVPRLTLPAVGAGDYSHTSSLHDSFGELVYTRWPIPPREFWLKHPEQHPLPSCLIE